ncbi:hypothetical protein KR032_008733 [Drosophila birchii]|nr:hypothetical protein KR032_008733 [Drosophila birchii]
MFRLVKRNVVTQTQQLTRSLTTDSHGLWAKYSFALPCQELADMSGSVAKRKAPIAMPTFPTLDLCDRFPKGQSQVQKPIKFRNLLSVRRFVDPSRLQYVRERHKQFIGEVELRQKNAKPTDTWESLHTARWWPKKGKS